MIHSDFRVGADPLITTDPGSAFARSECEIPSVMPAVQHKNAGFND